MEDKSKRGFWSGRLGIRVFRKDGTVEDHGEGPNTITDTGVAALCDDWYNDGKDITAFNYHAMGTGGSTPPPATSKAALVTEVESRVAGTKSQPLAYQLRTVATITATASRAIDEWGLFNAASSGVMLACRDFTEVNLATDDSIEFTYTFTFNSFTS